MPKIIHLKGTTQVITSNTAFINARLIRVTNVGTNTALLTVSDPVANTQTGSVHLVGGSSLVLKKEANAVLMSNSASVVGVAIATEG